MNAPEVAQQEQRRPPLLSRVPARARVAALTVALASTAAALTLVVGLHDPLLAGASVPWWALVPAFAAAEFFVVNLHLRREAFAVSLAELPLVVGLFLLEPRWLILAALVGAGLSLAAQRQSLYKLAFNAALVWFSTALVAGVFHLVVVRHDALGVRGWLAAFAACTLSELSANVAIAAAVRIYEGRAQEGTARSAILMSGVATFTNTSLGLLTVVVVALRPQAAWLLLVLAVVLFATYRAYGSLRQRHLSVEALYDLHRALERVVDLQAAVATLLAETGQILRGELVEVWLLDPEARNGIVRLGLHPGGQVRWLDTTADPLDAVARGVVASGHAVLLNQLSKDPQRRPLAAAGLRDLMAAPLRGSEGPVGALVTANRLPAVETFDRADLRMFETIASHAGVALQNGRLVERLRMEAAEKEWSALHDGLTGLANRELFTRQLRRAVDSVADGCQVAVLLADLDRFKEVNDTLGHGVGDRLLQQLAARLTHAFSCGETVARLGGDEFAVLLPSADSHRALEAAATLREVIAVPVEFDGLVLDVAACVGVALGSSQACDGAELLQRADVAMYAAKASHRGVEVYDPETDPYSPARLSLVGELRRALERDELAVHYQPKVDAATGEVVGAEALVRWPHPERGFIPPDVFIPIAEQAGLVQPLTSLVLRHALAQCGAWRRSGLPLHVAVNLSVRSLTDAHLADELRHLLAEADLPGEALTLEVTESGFMTDPDRAVHVLHRLRGLGIALSIDDYGTQYASLTYLKRLPADELKIDRSFVSEMATAPNDAAIVRSTVQLGHSLGMRVVAEGVEDHRTWRQLVDVGCDLIQGYAVAKPVDAEQFRSWLAEQDTTRRLVTRGS